MNPVAELAAIVAALVHVYFFVLESLWFMRERVWSRFGLASAEEARVVRSFAYNQGFYNLFLAAGVILGLVLVTTGFVDAGRAIVLFACGSMIAAGTVLFLHNRRFLQAATIQAVPPLVAVVVAMLLP